MGFWAVHRLSLDPSSSRDKTNMRFWAANIGPVCRPPHASARRDVSGKDKRFWAVLVVREERVWCGSINLRFWAAKA
tara:strand:- start:2691 stop:2921 length:231 start_codon:yes stop_codon:yes gene_type:complete